MQGLRTINPLEASLAAESMLMYPGGREVLMHQFKPRAPQQVNAPHGQPFASLDVSPGALCNQGAQELDDQESGEAHTCIATQRVPVHQGIDILQGLKVRASTLLS
jgi:hypothetical protein